MLGEGSIPESDWEIPESDIEFGVQIAQGNFGRIYKGSYFGTEVAIKLILPCETSDMTHKYIEREVTVLKYVFLSHMAWWCCAMWVLMLFLPYIKEACGTRLWSTSWAWCGETATSTSSPSEIGRAHV